MIRFFTDPCTYKFGHEDPDNSGLCIHCSAILDPDEDDIRGAEEEGRAVPNEVRRYAAVWADLRKR